MNSTRHRLASDNYSGVHPTIMQAIVNANIGHNPAYGDDDYSHKLTCLIHQHFGKQATGFVVFNGTGANVLGLSALLPRFGAVIAVKSAHINNDESIAPEAVAGIKILTVDSDNGKLCPTKIKALIDKSPHKPQACAMYISQTTELGTCYSLDELATLRGVCDQYGLSLYIDGARLCNAVAYLGCSLQQIAQYADILSLGGTKNGLMLGECLIVMNPKYAPSMAYLRKSYMQLASKMRFICAQFVAWLDNDLYLELARQSNAMATYLQEQLQALPNITITQKSESNAVFAILPKAVSQTLCPQFGFYIWNDVSGEVRLMTSFDTTKEQIDDFVLALKTAVQDSQ